MAVDAAVSPLYIFWFLHQTTTTLPPCPARRWLYIFWFLHQTTTPASTRLSIWCCISFDSYIKPQLMLFVLHTDICCISFDSYIKPQLITLSLLKTVVVYLLIPTSNHNWRAQSIWFYWLYIFWFLHQTTTSVLV